MGRRAALAFVALLLASPLAAPAEPPGSPSARVLERARFVVFLIPHSHWDIDWLMPWSQASEVARSIILSAAQLADRQSGFRFVADQVAFLKYCWDRSSEAEKRLLRTAVEKGSIEVAGGMVSQPDTVLPSEQGLLWDVLLGHSWVVETLGVEPSPVAWQCDPFGHAPTLPELLVASGYRYVYFGRCGEGQEAWLPHAFWWVGPTGAKVLAFFRGYCDGEFLLRAASADEVRDRLLEIVKDAMSRDGINATILPVGCDFTQPPPNLVRLVDEWNSKYLESTGVGLVVATPTEAFRFIEERYGGKLREVKLDPNPLWQGWYLTRPAAKLAERRASYLLSAVTRMLPLAGIAGLNTSQLAERARRAWFEACMNHHHDSITGTSPDSTWSQSIWPRYERSLAEAEKLFEEALESLAASVGGRSPFSIVVFNPSARVRRGVVLANVTLPSNITSPVAVEGEGGAYPVQVLRRWALNSTHALYELAAETGYVPPLGYKSLELKEGGAEVPAPARASLEGDRAVLENAYVRLVVNLRAGGVLEELVDKVSGTRILEAGSGEVVYYRDWGDVYGFSLGSAIAVSRSFRVEKAEVVWSGPLAAKLRVKLSGAAALELEYTLYYDERGFDLAATVAALKDSTAALALRGLSGRFVSGVAFGAVERPLDSRFWPVGYWFAVERPGGPSLAVVNRGAAQGVRSYAGEIEIGLTRDCSTPKRDKITFTDQEPHRIELRFLIYEGSWRERLLWLDAYDFNYPLIAVAAPPGNPVLPPQLGLMSADGGAELVDALPLGDSTYVFVFSNPLAGAFQALAAFNVSKARISLVDGRELGPAQLRALRGASEIALSGAISAVKLGLRGGYAEVGRGEVELKVENLTVEGGRKVDALVSMRDAAGAPLAGKLVELWCSGSVGPILLARALTGLDGNARFSLEANASGPSRVFARFAGDLAHRPAESRPALAELQPRYRVTLLVVGPLGEPVASAYVSAAGAGVQARAYTDASGRAELTLPPGSYTVRVLHGSARAELNVDVAGPREIRVTISSPETAARQPTLWLAALAAGAALAAFALARLTRRRARG